MLNSHFFFYCVQKDESSHWQARQRGEVMVRGRKGSSIIVDVGGFVGWTHSRLFLFLPLSSLVPFHSILSLCRYSSGRSFIRNKVSCRPTQCTPPSCYHWHNHPFPIFSLIYLFFRLALLQPPQFHPLTL